MQPLINLRQFVAVLVLLIIPAALLTAYFRNFQPESDGQQSGGASGHQASAGQRARYFFDRCMQDLLSFDTAYVTRPLVILSVYGHVQAYFQRCSTAADREWPHAHDFGQPQGFRPQSARIKAELRRKLRMAATELRLIVGDRFGGLGKRLPWRRRDHEHF